MKKQDLIDALRSLNVQDEEMHSLTMAQMGKLLGEILKNRREEGEPEKPKNLYTVEVTRSYSRKLNLGNYESEDFFCSRKAEVRNGDDVEAVSKYLAYDCKTDVENEIAMKLLKRGELPF